MYSPLRPNLNHSMRTNVTTTTTKIPDGCQNHNTKNRNWNTLQLQRASAFLSNGATNMRSQTVKVFLNTSVSDPMNQLIRGINPTEYIGNSYGCIDMNCKPIHRVELELGLMPPSSTTFLTCTSAISLRTTAILAVSEWLNWKSGERSPVIKLLAKIMSIGRLYRFQNISEN